MMDLAKLSKKIDILKMVESPDGFGGFELSWEVLATAWANVTLYKMVQNSTLSSLDKKVTTKFTIRSRMDLLPNCRIKYQDNIYEIARIRTDSKDENFMEICGFIK